MLPSKNKDVRSHLTGAGESTWVRCLLLELIHWARQAHRKRSATAHLKGNSKVKFSQNHFLLLTIRLPHWRPVFIVI